MKVLGSYQMKNGFIIDGPRNWFLTLGQAQVIRYRCVCRFRESLMW